ncbi:MAG: hypothetical protein ACO3YZ_07405, partial [Candidatus Nanopelagicaceae bacterium]
MKRIKNGIGFTPLLQSYVEGQKGIPYRKELNLVTGWATASILLQQAIYWSSRSNPFYKFQAPCGHELYSLGDSWQEELGFSRSEFEKAIKCIGTRINKGDKKSEIAAREVPQSMILYWTDRNRVTWWELNVPLVTKMVEKCLQESARLSNAVTRHQISKGLTQHQVMMKQRIRLRSETNSENNSECVEQAENLEKQPTHTGNSENFEDDRSETLEQHPSETLDSGTLEQESLEIQTPVKKSKTEIEYLDLNNNPGLGISSAGARENLTSPAENAPKTRGNDLKVSNPSQPHSVPLSEFIQVYNKHRGNWRSIGVAPAPVVVAGIFGYRQSFTGTDEEFLAKFPLLLKAAQSSGGNWFKSKRNPSEIFHPDR